ncbi:MAG: hypothetical protein AAGG44_18915, partial [Planctomycetota bacterium]
MTLVIVFFSASATRVTPQEIDKTSGKTMVSTNEDGNEPEAAKPYPNVPLPTLGGKQFWTDFAWRRGWRLQKNAVTGLWR